MNMKVGTKLALIAVGSVVVAGLSAVLIPQPYGAIIAATISVCAGLWLKSFFENLKGY